MLNWAGKSEAYRVLQAQTCRNPHRNLRKVSILIPLKIYLLKGKTWMC